MSCMKVTDEIFQVGGSDLTAPNDAAVYLINFEGHVLLIDSGCGKSVDKLLQNIKACNIQPQQIQYILLTHCHYDHSGGADKIRKVTNCKIVAHEMDAIFLEEGNNEVTAASWYGTNLNPFKVDIQLSGANQDIFLGNRIIKAIHIPGHSPGSLAFLTESQGLRVLFGQDIHGPLDSSLLSDRKDYIQSLRLLLSLKIDILCEGHYGIYKNKDAQKFIENFLI